MAAVSLNSNLAALRAKRALNASSAALSSTLERLSSGTRINHASDDAAGLAVASTLNATARIHTQAARNVNEAISYLNVADGATSALKDILFRLRELSTQSSNGTFSNAQRQSIDKEAQALQAEYGRILDSTSYNGIRVFASGDMVAQAGVGIDAALVANIGGASSTTTSVTRGDGTFQARQAISTGANPYSVAIADLNNDGKSDLVSSDWGSNTASVLLGNGNGTFQARLVNDVGPGPYGVAVADFNGDGKRDVVVGDDFASVLLGNGNGTLQARVSFAAGSIIWDVDAADLNGDGKSDLIVVDAQNNKLDVLLGNGNGTFQVRHTFGTGTGPEEAAVADLNGDGKSDLISADFDGDTVSVLLGNGNGTFQALRANSVGAGPYEVAVTDFNGDGKNDMVVSDDSVSILLGNGNGTFQARQPFDVGSCPSGVAVADIDGDGKSDIVAINTKDPTADVLLGNGNGTFQATRTFGTGATSYGVIPADFNGDGAIDLAVADSADNTVSVLLGNGTTTTTTTTVDALQPITGVSLATQQDALLAQAKIDSYLDTVNEASGTIGTALRRFQIAAYVASSVADVSQAAEARITDADTAENSAALLRSKILQNAASAVLAQANQQPALALALLRE